MPDPRIEFHRQGITLFPKPDDPKPGVAMWVKADKSGRDYRACTCPASKRGTCHHQKELSGFLKNNQDLFSQGGFDTPFRNSALHRWAAVLFDISRRTPEEVTLQPDAAEAGGPIEVLDSKGSLLFTYHPVLPGSDMDTAWSDAALFVSRCSYRVKGKSAFHRLDILRQMAALTYTETERAMLARGAMTRRLALENSLWYRVMYHLFRRMDKAPIGLQAEIAPRTGVFSLRAHDQEKRPLFSLPIARERVPALVAGLKGDLNNAEEFKIHPVPVKSVVRIRLNQRKDLVLQRYLYFSDDQGRSLYRERKELENFRYEDLFYWPEIRRFVRIEQPDLLAEQFQQAFTKIVKNEKIPAILAKLGDSIWGPPHLVDDSVRNMRIFRTFERIEIEPKAIERDWYWLSIHYGLGNNTISLQEILSARKTKQRFIPVPGGFIDCQSFQGDEHALMNQILQAGSADPLSGAFRLSALDLYRLQAGSESPLKVTGTDTLALRLQQALALRPATPLPELGGMTSTLRPYQTLGSEWLSFLYENRFGGLLCDDMGLGKTHQVMALMVWLKEHKNVDRPFLVVCPTTVLSHWADKIKAHAPGLQAAIYHGTERDSNAVAKEGVLLTSYGLLWRDLPILNQRTFTLAVFDEAQNIKNPATKVYEAAQAIRAEMKLCVSGTPIENHLGELKALMDLSVPGYLGSDTVFDMRYVQPISQYPNSGRAKELSRLIAPFTLRRLKKTVLDELPPKIEDLRFCSLSEDQVTLYNHAIQSKGRRLLSILRENSNEIPYLHIFAVLNILKQICNHPALLEGRESDYERYASGKWELFKELMAEGLASGQKIVVYSQYVGMVRIIKHYLDREDIGAVTLTGQSRKRGDIIHQFNTDPACRVFVGSLKAGGTGIDLVAASMVIHYDRWWNAAREDQATDRVHRIGQNRGVQVFKLITQGTLEEKIAAIIAKKRDLMDNIVTEDDPAVTKVFSREQLIDLLSLS